jgi:hypothetical protein
MDDGYSCDDGNYRKYDALIVYTTKGDGIIYEKLMKNYFKVLGVSFEDM